MKRTEILLVFSAVLFLISQTPASPQTSGDLYSTDSIVGKMRYVPAGVYTQGSPVTEPGRNPEENQFIHFLTGNIAVMETAITCQRGADLKLTQSSNSARICPQSVLIPKPRQASGNKDEWGERNENS